MKMKSLIFGTAVVFGSIATRVWGTPAKAPAPEAALMSGMEPRVFPNPWRSDRDGATSITFDRLPSDSTVRVFTTSGREIKTLDAASGTATWDGTNDSGERVASGIYLFLVSDILGQEHSGKFAIIR